MFSFGSAVVSWNNKKQSTIALSNTKAEYKDTTIATCEIVWLQKLISNLRQSMNAPIIIFVITSIAYYVLALPTTKTKGYLCLDSL